MQRIEDTSQAVIGDNDNPAVESMEEAGTRAQTNVQHQENWDRSMKQKIGVLRERKMKVVL